MITVFTNIYERNTGRKPKGFGTWAFSIGNTDGYKDVEKAYFCKPAKYSDAVKEANAEAKSRKVTSIYVLP